MSTTPTTLSRQLSNNATAALDATTEAAEQAMDDLVQQAQGLAQRTSDLVHESAAQVRRKAEHARDVTRGYIEHDPLKAVLIAAAAGAGLVLLGSLLTRSTRDSR